MPAFCVIPNRSPLGLSRSISGVSGSSPAGPAAEVCNGPIAAAELSKESRSMDIACAQGERKIGRNAYMLAAAQLPSSEGQGFGERPPVADSLQPLEPGSGSARKKALDPE